MKKLSAILIFAALSIGCFAQKNKPDFFASNLLDTESNITADADSIWTVSGIGHLGLGFGAATDADANIRTKPMFLGDLFIQVVGVKFQPAPFFAIRTGIGFEDKVIRTSGRGNAWFKQDDNVGIVEDLGIKVNHSRLHIHSVYAPLLVAVTPVKGLKLTFGPELHWNYSASSAMKCTEGDRTTKVSDHKYKVERITYDLYASAKFWGICLFAKYQPQEVFQTGFGPKVKYFSFGMVL